MTERTATDPRPESASSNKSAWIYFGLGVMVIVFLLVRMAWTVKRTPAESAQSQQSPAPMATSEAERQAAQRAALERRLAEEERARRAGLYDEAEPAPPSPDADPQRPRGTRPTNAPPPREWSGGSVRPAGVGSRSPLARVEVEAPGQPWRPGGDVAPRRPFVRLSAGSALHLTTDTAIDSDGGDGGLIRAHVARDVYGEGRGGQPRLVFPAGTRLVGDVRSLPSQRGREHVHLAFTQVVLPRGKNLSLAELPGHRGDGALGIEGQVKFHLLSRYGSAFLSALVGAVARVAVDDRVTVVDGAGSYDFGRAAGQGFGDSSVRVTDRLLDEAFDRSPSVEIPAGAHVTLLLPEDAFVEVFR